MAVSDRLAQLVGLGDWLHARRLRAEARQHLPERMARLATDASPAARANTFGVLAELHGALGRHTVADAALRRQHIAGARIYRLLADAERAAASRGHRVQTAGVLEPRIGAVLDRIAATTNLANRPTLLDELQAALGQDPAAGAVAALPRTVPAAGVLRSPAGLRTAAPARPVAAQGPPRTHPPPAAPAAGAAMQAFAPLSVHAGTRADAAAPTPPDGTRRHSAPGR